MVLGFGQTHDLNLNLLMNDPRAASWEEKAIPHLGF